MADSRDFPIGWEIIENPPRNQWADATAATEAWEQLKQQLSIGTILTGSVFLRTPFGVFFDAGLGFPALMEITEFDRPQVLAADSPALYSVVSGQLWGFNDDDRQLRVVKIQAQNIVKAISEETAEDERI